MPARGWVIVAALSPLVAAALQWAFWDQIQPAHWLFFFPAMLAAALIGGFQGGVLATLNSAFLVYFVFLRPHFTLAIERPKDLLQFPFYVGMGIAFSVLRSAHDSVREKAARADESLRLRRVVKSSPTPILVTDPEGNVVDMNSGFVRQFGWKREDAPSLAAAGLLAAPIAPDPLPDDPEAGLVEARVTRKDGEVRTVLATRAAFEFGSVSWFVDVTDRRASERSIREQAEFLALAQKAARAGTWRWEVRGSRLSWSPEMFQLFGLDPRRDVPSPESWRQALHPDDREAAERTVATAVERGTFYEDEYRVILPGGNVRWIHAAGSFLHDGAGRPDRMTGLCVDDTERRNAESERQLAEEKLRAANLRAEEARRKSEFLALVSHELKTPLVSVVGMADLVLEQELPPGIRKPVEAIASGGRRLVHLVNDAVEIARIDAGKAAVFAGPTPLKMIARAAVQPYVPACEKKGQTLESSVEPSDLSIETDGEYLVRLLRALVSNAVKFTSDGGRVGVEIVGDAGSKSARITVWDGGIGIAPEDLVRLFQPFGQLHGGLSRAYGGFGLGLALADRIAHLLGTSIVVESEVGRGSRFSVSFPWTPPAGPGDAP